MTSDEPGATSRDDVSEQDTWRALLNRLGFQDLQLPSDGTLGRQWQEFLKELEAESKSAKKPKKSLPARKPQM